MPTAALDYYNFRYEAGPFEGLLEAGGLLTAHLDLGKSLRSTVRALKKAHHSFDAVLADDELRVTLQPFFQMRLMDESL